jgi:hypothetical protein
MTPSILKALHQAANPESPFFDRATMRFFGDTMRNYSVHGPVTLPRASGEPETLAWELRRKQPVKARLQTSQFFDAASFDLVHYG